MATGDEVDRLRTDLRALREAMRTRPAIDQAKGMLMAVHRCDAEQAWATRPELSAALRDVMSPPGGETA